MALGKSFCKKKKFFFFGGGGIFFLVIGITYNLQNNFQSFWSVKIFTFKFYEYSISFIYMIYIRKKQTSADVFSKSNEYY